MFSASAWRAPLHPAFSTSDKGLYVNFDGLCLAKRYFTADTCRWLRIYCTAEPYCRKADQRLWVSLGGDRRRRYCETVRSEMSKPSFRSSP